MPTIWGRNTMASSAIGFKKLVVIARMPVMALYTSDLFFMDFRCATTPFSEVMESCRKVFMPSDAFPTKSPSSE